MPARRNEDSQPHSRQMPARTSEGEEIRLIALAEQVVERQMMDGTVSSQVLTHYLKLGSQRNRIEIEKIKSDIRLNEQKVRTAASAEQMEKIAKDAMDAMTRYQGRAVPAPVEEGDYDD